MPEVSERKVDHFRASYPTLNGQLLSIWSKIVHHFHKDSINLE
jgi:hypothetical protein